MMIIGSTIRQEMAGGYAPIVYSLTRLAFMEWHTLQSAEHCVDDNKKARASALASSH
ncbi:hypothetical protein [Vibrio mediterranei]|uniref:hypothetical protein n=1 Tax=Vibrio mediterranei TaxID=689 RepID=UPI0040676E5F